EPIAAQEISPEPIEPPAIEPSPVEEPSFTYSAPPGEEPEPVVEPDPEIYQPIAFENAAVEPVVPLVEDAPHFDVVEEAPVEPPKPHRKRTSLLELFRSRSR